MFPLLVILGLILSSMFFVRNAFIKTQNKKSIKFYTDTSSLENQDFCLYLRSFQEDSYKKQQIPTSFVMPFGSPSVSVDMEIYSLLKDDFPIIKITNTRTGNEQVGVSQISLEKGWKEKVLGLMHKCKHIIIKPSDTGGLIWELDQIVAHKYLNKTIFIGSYSSSNIKAVEKIKRKRFLNILKTRYNIKTRRKPLLTTINNTYFFTIVDSKIQYKNYFDLKRIIKKQAKAFTDTV